MAIIEALIEKDRLEPFIQTVNTQKKSFHGIVSVAPQFTGEEWEIVKEAAARRGVDTETFIRESAMQWAKQIQDAKIASDLMAAEDDTRD